jgi:hypothetical protein
VECESIYATWLSASFVSQFDFSQALQPRSLLLKSSSCSLTDPRQRTPTHGPTISDTSHVRVFWYPSPRRCTLGKHQTPIGLKQPLTICLDYLSLSRLCSFLTFLSTVLMRRRTANAPSRRRGRKSMTMYKFHLSPHPCSTTLYPYFIRSNTLIDVYQISLLLNHYLDQRLFQNMVEQTSANLVSI